MFDPPEHTPNAVNSATAATQKLRVLCLLQHEGLQKLVSSSLSVLAAECVVERPAHTGQGQELDLGRLADALGSSRWDLALLQSDASGNAGQPARELLQGLRPDLPVLALSGVKADALGETSGQSAQENGCSESYQTLADASGDCVLRLTPDGRLLYVNQVAQRMFDLQPGQCQGRLLSCFNLPQDVGELLHQETQNVFADGQRRRFCWSMPQGEEGSYFEAGIDAEASESGQTSVVLATLRDVSEVRKAEIALSRSERKFRSSFEQAAIGMVHTDLGGMIQQVNASFAAMLGYGRNELAGLHVDDVTHAEDRSLSNTLIQSLYKTPWGVASMEKRYLRKDGSICWGRVHVSSVTDNLGTPLYFLAQVEDISETKELMDKLVQAKKQAEAASKAKSQFLANMSHELRTPLNGIIGMTQLALGGELEQEQREHLESSLKASRNLLAAVNKLLELSTLDSQSIRLEDKPFEIRERIAPLLERLAKEAWSKGLRFNYAFSTDVPAVVSGDAAKIAQALLNVVDNAIRFTEQGSVSVGISCESCEALESADRDVVLQFSVKDTGVGIAADKQQSIFDPFSMAEDLLTKRYSGIGLGLAVSRQLVEHMGGRIWVRSKPGQGSAFFFTCPVTVVAVSANGQEHRSVRTLAARPYRVLVAEDEPISQELTRKLLQRRGHTAKVASDGQEALELLQKNTFDLVLMDIQMPRMNGLDAARCIREGAVPMVPADLPIIALTAYAAEEDKHQALAVGMNAFVAKPFDAPALAQVINEVMASHNGAREYEKG